MTGFSIREAESSDAQAIARIQIENWKNSFRRLISDRYLDALDVEDKTRQWTTRISGTSAVVLVAEDASGVTGFLSGGRIRRPIYGYDAELYALFVRDGKQAQGVEQALLKSFASFLERQGFQSLSTWIFSGASARGLYEDLGGTALAQREIEIGGELVPEVAYGWSDLHSLRC